MTTGKRGGANRKDLAGQIFGRLTVIDFAFTQTKKAFWNCRCDCGVLRVIQGCRMLRGLTASCGCLRRENGKKGVEARRKTASASRPKLTPAEALAIRLEYAEGQTTHRQLAAKYGVDASTIGGILRGQNWQDVGGPLAKSENKLTADTARAIREEYRKGQVTQSNLATRYGVSEDTIGAVVRREIWRHVPDLDPKIIDLYQASILKPIDPNRRLSDADAARIFGVTTEWGKRGIRLPKQEDLHGD